MISPPKSASDESRLETEILELAAHIDAAMHRFLTLVRRFDASGDWAGVGLKSCAHWLSWRCGLSLGAARERVRVARALGELPAIDEALSKGLLSYSKVRAMTRVARPENEAKLLYTAKATTAAQLERVCRGVAVCQRQEGADGAQQPVGEDERWVQLKRGDGDLVRVEVQLHADEAALVMQAIDEVRRRASEALAPDPEGERPRFGRADALVRAADVLLAGGAAAADVGDVASEAEGEEARAEPRFFRPDGRELAAPSRYPLTPAEAVASLRAGNEKAGAHIDARTSESEWRGERPDYGYMVARLV